MQTQQTALEPNGLKQGVALTGRYTTGPPCSVTDPRDDRWRRQTTTDARKQNNTGLYTMCRRSSNNIKMLHFYREIKMDL